MDSLVLWALSSPASPVKVWEYDLKAEESRLYQYGRLENPAMGYDYDADYYIFGVSQFVSNPYLIRYHRMVGKAKVSLKGTALLMDSLNFVSQIKLMYYSLVLKRHRLEVMERRIAALDSLIAQVDRGVKVGRFPEAHLQAVRAKREHLVGRMAVLEGEYRGSLMRLSEIVGREVKGVEDPGPLPAIPPPESLALAVSESPLLKAKGITVSLLEAEVGYERALALPGVEISGGIYRYRDVPITGITLGVSVPLPIFNDNRGNVGAARYSLKRERADSAHTHALLVGRVLELAEIYNSLREKLTRMDGVELPSLRRAYESTLKAYVAGAVGYSEVFASMDALFDAEVEREEVKVRAMGILTEIERILGRTFKGGRK